ncbi:hypothetical protein [Rhizobium sp. BT03]|uniref:hypothetical protein n=1 Tax=Rhizobium sp. BT03 TaxID=3045156 RepID=UPI0024B3D816|nr:hypothetical protein [Rhizobium sp. BT03]WHO72389.1 hypothetical protein QMO80_001412 [Rhizobium sp. BT03]
MSLIKFFLKPMLDMNSVECADAVWKNDPLRHPEVERMSLREIADLPLGTEIGSDAKARPPLAKCA